MRTLKDTLMLGVESGVGISLDDRQCAEVLSLLDARQLIKEVLDDPDCQPRADWLTRAKKLIGEP